MTSETICTRLTESLGWGHERVELLHDRDSGMRAVVAIHSTALGPALGGLRLRRYAHGLPEALDDALRLSRAMTLKAAAAGLDLGGGKAVLLDDGRDDLRAPRLAAFGRALDALGGSYITAEDVGTTTADMDLIALQTEHVVGRAHAGRVGGDPSPATAVGVFCAIGAALHALDGDDSLAGRRVGVVGLGKVGGRLARMLLDAGADVIGCDPDPDAFAALEGVRAAGTASLLAEPLDVLAPCALGGMIDTQVARELRCRIVCGAANNPLSGPDAAALLAARGILYVPDFLANCGGLVHVDAERHGEHDEAAVAARVAAAAERIRDTLLAARAEGRTPQEVAEERAWARVEQARERLAAAPAASLAADPAEASTAGAEAALTG
ncbi:Glu/Leu/Phe/Val dehydrogenase dimerization domain-containing protein [Conexibacter stalactiti]|uniref:Glu/Leu/Phe/Val dehydrogenase dimerization domain-containing protein n=1 Tax=Conexibacter stalactiti TaxID=1940611 RepID=A0ABU4HNE5_9ACTN|nr:Glu/Leu/Phe/Val dehydrogenase dimerization domain-containing protein [Conexibacter stalactiti]MDW5594827.1 Glu/Leu/Phe/Val dehydrogenase dimerization domain-containing protein [Conexibacter stalactiti]MEC5035469.1 Glu/Leu/Phe/Val dehydrogenase dimerization domain-containing protein [Conexibacter stalactiti]